MEILGVLGCGFGPDYAKQVRQPCVSDRSGRRSTLRFQKHPESMGLHASRNKELRVWSGVWRMVSMGAWRRDPNVEIEREGIGA